jgi:hypothetical protein
MSSEPSILPNQDESSTKSENLIKIYFKRLWKKWSDTPALFILVLLQLLTIVVPILNSFSSASMLFAGVNIVICGIVYQHLSCEYKIKKLLSNEDLIHSLKDKLIKKEVLPSEYDEILRRLQ